MDNTTTNDAQGLQGSSLSQFFTTLAFSAAIAVVEIILFAIIRTKFKRIYEPKTYLGDEKRQVEPLPRSLCGWLPALLRMPQEDLIRNSGLDAYFFARYLYVHGFFFLSSFVLLAIVLFPIYIVDGKGDAYGKRGLDILTFGNISPRLPSRYIAPLVLAYVFVAAFLYLLYAEMKAFVQKRQALLRSPAYQSRASASTILVRAIPKPYMSEAVLLRIFNRFPGGVRYIWLNRDLEDLPDKANQRTKLVGKLEVAQCKLIKAALKKQAKAKKKRGSILTSTFDASVEESIAYAYVPDNKRPTIRIGPIPVLSSLCLGRKVDTITHCKESISQLNTDIERAKSAPEDYAVTNSAFIQFNEPIAAHMAVQSVAASVPLAMTPRYINVKAANIVWSNLRLTYYEQKLRQLAMLAAVTALIIFWAIPVTFVGLLSNLTYLTDKVTFLRFIYNLPSFLLGIITGLLPTVLLAILMALLPVVLTLFAKLSGIPTTDAIDRHVQGSFFVFQVVHVFLVVTISSSVSSVIVGILQNPSSTPNILASNIPTASNFFLSFLALEGLSVASSILLQIVALILFYLLGKLFDNTPRKKWKRYFVIGGLSWGTVFPVFTNIVVITLVYSVIAPLMLLIAALAFGLFYVAYLYTMFFVTDFPDDTGGLAFPRAIYQSFTGVYLMEILLAGLFFLAQNDSGSQCAIPEGALMCALICITIAVQFVMKSSFDPLTYYLPVDADEFPQLETAISGKFPWSKKVISVLTIPGLKDRSDSVANINDAVSESEDRTMANAYLHPALRDSPPIVWIPQDHLGIAANEIRRTQASGLNISMSMEGARFNDEQKLKIDGPPPDYEQLEEEDLVRTRF